MLEPESDRSATDLFEAVACPIAHGIGQLEDEPSVWRKDEWNVENSVPSATAPRHACGNAHFVWGQLKFAGTRPRTKGARPAQETEMKWYLSGTFKFLVFRAEFLQHNVI